MDIYFSNKRLQKACDLKEATKLWGSENAKKLYQRLTELFVANNLSEISCLPQARCHELKGRRKGQFAVDLKHPFRLIFVPANNPVPRKKDGGIDLNRVTAICIIGVEDYHGE
ncbi:type II toxin-antitoxin system RelE/ParE family toxin [Neomoorella thermoacetica]|uniref:type II toxin-antitoxin system RelE/ParE family toxin n=1 Tax=Neomoorella thermoacetica TaxID=1525 RepID=UPI0030CCF5CE